MSADPWVFVTGLWVREAGVGVQWVKVGCAKPQCTAQPHNKGHHQGQQQGVQGRAARRALSRPLPAQLQLLLSLPEAVSTRTAPVLSLESSGLLGLCLCWPVYGANSPGPAPQVPLTPLQGGGPHRVCLGRGHLAGTSLPGLSKVTTFTRRGEEKGPKATVFGQGMIFQWCQRHCSSG